MLDDYAREVFADSYVVATGKVSDSSTALENVRRNLRRCQAQTRAGFINWALKQLAKEKGFHLVAGAVEKFDLLISNYVDDGRLRSQRYADFPEFIKNGPVYLVKMPTGDGFAIWSVPAEHWEFVKQIWPVFLSRKLNGGFFIAKKIGGVVVPVHRLVLDCEPFDTVQSTSGNLLDWTSLHTRPFNQSGIYAGRNTSWNKDTNRPNTASEEFNARMKPITAAKNYGITVHGERFSVPPQIPVNADTGTAGCFGKVGRVGWVKPITPAERDLQDATERYMPRVKPSARLQAAAKALTALGL